jgi:hypothetical protein
MNSVCGKVLGDFARSVLHHHRAVADPDHAIFGSEHGAEQDPGIRPDAGPPRTACPARVRLGERRNARPRGIGDEEPGEPALPITLSDCGGCQPQPPLSLPGRPR